MPANTLKTRLAVALSAVASALVATFVARAARVPAVPGFDASLLRQPNAIVAIIVVAVVTIALTALVSLAIGRMRREAGVFCAAVGLAAFSLRGGSITATLQYAGGPGVLLAMAVELLLLYAMLGAGVYVANMVAPRQAVAAANDDGHDLNHHLLAVAVQVVGMTIVLLILGQSEAKKQAIAAVAIAAYVGAIAAHQTFPVRNGLWLAIAPLPVGLLGYLLEYFEPTLLAIGLADQPLATAIPLDYAAAGVFGGILGHWMCQKWQAESMDATRLVATPAT